jgi:hypothetical protein
MEYSTRCHRDLVSASPTLPEITTLLIICLLTATAGTDKSLRPTLPKEVSSAILLRTESLMEIIYTHPLKELQGSMAHFLTLKVILI